MNAAQILMLPAFAEAAGWLAHTQAWVHPLDLALRDGGLTGPIALAAAGSGPRALPHTFAAGRTAWDDQTVDAFAAGDRSVADALALARILRRQAGSRAHDLFGCAATAEATLAPFGAGPLDPAHFAAWRAEVTSEPVPRRRFGRAEGGEGRRGGPPRRPPPPRTRPRPGWGQPSQMPRHRCRRCWRPSP